jgi:hypothetical protein
MLKDKIIFLFNPFNASYVHTDISWHKNSLSSDETPDIQHLIQIQAVWHTANIWL